jgi:hypothetical protein
MENSAFLVAKNYGFLFTENCGVLFTDYRSRLRLRGGRNNRVHE